MDKTIKLKTVLLIGGLTALAALIVVGATYGREEYKQRQEISKCKKDVRAKPAAEVYLKDDATSGDVAAIRKQLERIPKVTRVTFVSKDEALQRYKGQSERNQKLTEQLAPDENPLPPVFEIYTDGDEDVQLPENLKDQRGVQSQTDRSDRKTALRYCDEMHDVDEELKKYRDEYNQPSN